MTNRGFEKRLKIVIYDNINDNRLLNIYQMKIDFGCVVKYNTVDMFWGFMGKICIREGYHGVI